MRRIASACDSRNTRTSACTPIKVEQRQNVVRDAKKIASRRPSNKLLFHRFDDDDDDYDAISRVTELHKKTNETQILAHVNDFTRVAFSDHFLFKSYSSPDEFIKHTK